MELRIRKGGESEYFRIDSGVRQVCIMFPWVLNVYIDAVMTEVKMGMGKMVVRFMEEVREWSLSGFLYTDGELEEEQRAMVGRFLGVCKRRGLKVHAGKSKVMVLNGKEALECEV